MNRSEFNKKTKELLFGSRDSFLPPENHGPKSMAIMVLTFLFGVVGVGIVFLGDVNSSQGIKICGFVIAASSILTFLMAFIYRVFWTIKNNASK